MVKLIKLQLFFKTVIKIVILSALLSAVFIAFKSAENWNRVSEKINLYYDHNTLEKVLIPQSRK
jgi:hypothetical protein